jgi:hypothetical protein
MSIIKRQIITSVGESVRDSNTHTLQEVEMAKGPHLENSLGVSQNINKAGGQWLTPIILATQEAEIRAISDQSQSWANNLGESTLKEKNWWNHKKKKKGPVE